MHMADALLSPAVGGALWAVSGAAIAVSSRAMARSANSASVPLMGVMGAFVFAAQMINFTIPATGSSGHFAGGMLLTLLLGPYAAFLTIASVLTVQALMFADGGLLALGANIFNMGFIPCFVVYPLLFLPLSGKPGSLRYRGMIWATAIIALQIGALGVVLETTGSGIAELPFSAFLMAMQPIHLAIGIGEGLITLAVVEFVQRAEPGMFSRDTTIVPGVSRLTIGVLAVLAILTGGVLSWFASTFPDGLEWSVAKITSKTETAEVTDQVHELAASIQKKTAVMPDYNFAAPAVPADAKPEAEEKAWGTPDVGTSVAGLAGGLATLILAALAGWMLRRRTPVDSAS
jgi:cobalt/nickel transport system permease protein